MFRWQYHPYGTTAFQAKNASINAVAKRYRYTGKERDEESGLYYHGARYYIPWLCRWTAIDPMESKYAGMSPYNYFFNNPIMFNDLNGADAGDPPKDGDIRLENGIEYMYSTSPDQNGQASWGALPPTFTVSAQAIPAIVDDGLAQYSNNVKLSAELMMSSIPILGKNMEIIDDLTGEIAGEIDVLTPNAAIQYKDGVSGAKKIIQQVTENTEPFLNMPVVTFVKGSAETAKATTRTVQRAGPYVLVTNNMNLLINTIR
ncbi:MAG: RHS repeat-associated core domain-containing protein [Taibaiella sp.]|nr:RHS repeat-associated core domain-containing protein [Taibaiella sp.]